MQKILTIARREYQAMVATKAFVIGIALMPVLMLGGMWIPGLLKGMERAEDRRIAIVDRSGQLFEPLKMVAIQRNQMLQTATEEPSSSNTADATKADGGVVKILPKDKNKEGDQQARKAMGLEEIHRYLLESVPAEGFGDEQRLALSERIRSGDLYAFVEIPADVLLPQPPDPSSAALLQLPEITYVAQDAALADAKRWVDTALNQLIRANRLTTAGVAPIVLLELERKAPVVGSGLYVRDEAGKISSEKKPNELASIFLPMGLMMLMFMIVMM
jgi:ABC-type Na+ efflux pump permease subunit